MLLLHFWFGRTLWVPFPASQKQTVSVLRKLRGPHVTLWLFLFTGLFFDSHRVVLQSYWIITVALKCQHVTDLLRNNGAETQTWRLWLALHKVRSVFLSLSPSERADSCHVCGPVCCCQEWALLAPMQSGWKRQSPDPPPGPVLETFLWKNLDPRVPCWTAWRSDRWSISLQCAGTANNFSEYVQFKAVTVNVGL